MTALARAPARCWLLALALFCVGLPWQDGDTFLPLYGLVTHTAIGLAAAAFVLPAAVVPVTPAERTALHWPVAFLSSPPMVWLGTISYGIYLWHKPLLDMLAGTSAADSVPAGSAPGLIIATVAGSVVLGAASWYLVERPAQRRWRLHHGPVVVLAG